MPCPRYCNYSVGYVAAPTETATASRSGAASRSGGLTLLAVPPPLLHVERMQHTTTVYADSLPFVWDNDLQQALAL
jgi:hypothetical protein